MLLKLPDGTDIPIDIEQIEKTKWRIHFPEWVSEETKTAICGLKESAVKR